MHALDSKKIAQALVTNGLNASSFSFGESTFKRLRNGRATTATLVEVASKLGCSLDELFARYREVEPSRVLSFVSWNEPDPLRICTSVEAIRRNQSIEIRWAGCVSLAFDVAQCIVEELGGSDPRASIARLDGDARLFHLRWARSKLSDCRRLMAATDGGVQDLVHGMEHYFGGGATVESACGSMLRLVASKVMAELLDAVHEFLDVPEVERLTASGLPSWLCGPLPSSYEMYGRALGIADPVIVQITSIGGFRGTVDVHCDVAEGQRVRSFGVGTRTVPLSWVHQRAIPSVALARLVDGESGIVDYDEDLRVNKLKFSDGREG
ncbi:MAG: hypothetical protein H6737_09060 [Alphaproteobacteria bacterium]|nr:hypothetical protein [Alphaproteobacteria bacterium]